VSKLDDGLEAGSVLINRGSPIWIVFTQRKSRSQGLGKRKGLTNRKKDGVPSSTQKGRVTFLEPGSIVREKVLRERIESLS